jgi:predicted nucleotidyltransferase
VRQAGGTKSQVTGLEVMSEALETTQKKRLDLQLAVTRLLAPEPCVQGVVAVGSVATGHASAGSDIDAIVFMEPL